MLKYKDRKVEVICGIVKVYKEGTPLDGKFFFRKKEYQDVFDWLRNRLYIDDYWTDKFGKFHFRFLDGSEEVYSCYDIRRMANEDLESY